MKLKMDNLTSITLLLLIITNILHPKSYTISQRARSRKKSSSSQIRSVTQLHSIFSAHYKSDPSVNNTPSFIDTPSQIDRFAFFQQLQNAQHPSITPEQLPPQKPNTLESSQETNEITTNSISLLDGIITNTKPQYS